VIEKVYRGPRKTEDLDEANSNIMKDAQFYPTQALRMVVFRTSNLKNRGIVDFTDKCKTCPLYDRGSQA